MVPTRRHLECHRLGAIQKGFHLHHGPKFTEFHGRIRPPMMNRNGCLFQTHFTLETRHPLQSHFILNKTQSFETKLVVLSSASDGDTLTTRCGGSNTAVLESDQRGSAGVRGFAIRVACNQVLKSRH